MNTDPVEQILLVDDSPVNLQLLSQLLGERGYHVRAVTSGPRALASVRMALPDLILLDIRMPGMDGYQVCEQLKGDPHTADIPILFISALDDLDDKVRAFGAGGVDYITKPFQLGEVLARVQTHLALRRLQRDLQAANDRMQQQLALAAQVQNSFIRRALPAAPGWQLAVSLIPAMLTSGDFYDVMTLPGDGLGIVMADVVDKGVGAALYMAMSCALLRAFIVENDDRPDLVCRAVHQQLVDYTHGNQFVTVFLGILDIHTGILRYSNAGHNPPVLLSAALPESPQLLRRTGLPLGLMEESTWQFEQVTIAPGDILILYTDGLTEAENAEREPYELNRLMEAASARIDSPATDIRDAILAAVRAFIQGVPLADDMALMVLRRAHGAGGADVA